MRIETLSVFPDMFEGPMSLSIIGRARKKGILDFEAYDLRDWTHDRHRSTDDEPYGGGQGLLMTCPPVFEALDELCSEGPKPTVIFFTPTGEPFSQKLAQELSHHERLLMVCGRYEGFDERVMTLADRCISLGDYVLTGGELPAMVVADAVTRLLPGALGGILLGLRPAGVPAVHAPGELPGPRRPRGALVRKPRCRRRLASQGGHREDRAAASRPDRLRRPDRRRARLRPRYCCR